MSTSYPYSDFYFDETAASVLLAADMLGNIRTQTMCAFTSSEMEKILANVPDRQ